jgi:U3 small nucleolar RNA-associated protein 13
MSDGVVEVVIATKGLELKHYRVQEDSSVLVRSWKSHTMPVSAMQFDPTGTVVACGSSDGRIFVYDLAQGVLLLFFFLLVRFEQKKGHTTHALRGHAGPILCLAFHPDVHRVMLLSGSQDGTLRCWDLRSSDGRLLKVRPS